MGVSAPRVGRVPRFGGATAPPHPRVRQQQQPPESPREPPAMADTAAEFLSLIGACTVPGARWGDTGCGGTDRGIERDKW